MERHCLSCALTDLYALIYNGANREAAIAEVSANHCPDDSTRTEFARVLRPYARRYLPGRRGHLRQPR